VDFRNAVLVMTSNVGSAGIFELAGRNPEQARQQALEALRATFRPEFLNRIDDIVLFNPLGKPQLEKIVELQLAEVAKRLAERNVTIELTQAARERLLAEGYDPAYGARPLRRTVQRLVQDPLAMKILDGSVLPGDHVLVDADRRSGEMVFQRTGEQVAAATDAARSGRAARQKA